MRRPNSMQLLSLIVLLLLVVASPAVAALRDNYVGDVAVVAWLDGGMVKVALANESTTRKSITIASGGWDQRWQPFFLDRTVVVPARAVLVEGFTLNSHWRGEPLVVEVSAWDRSAVVEVQTQDIFCPNAYVVGSEEEVSVRVDLEFMASEPENVYLSVDDYYYTLSAADSGQIFVRAVEGGFQYSSARRRVEQIKPYMQLSMRTPRTKGEAIVFTFSLYRHDDSYQNRYQDEIPGPTILVIGRDLSYHDNSHLTQPPTPPWNWGS